MDVLKLVNTFDLRALKDRAKKVFALVDACDKDWKAMMPTWKTKGHKRGLMAWGETRGSRTKQAKAGSPVKSRKVKQKAGCIPEICRAPIMLAVDLYFNKIGVPPVQAGT